MRTRTVTVREGELLGPVDPDYDTGQHSCVNPDLAAEGWARILEMGADPEGWVYLPSGFTAFRVVHVGMYDGWPFWRPTPSIGYIGPLNSVEWEFFYNLRKGNTRKGAPTYPRVDR